MSRNFDFAPVSSGFHGARAAAGEHRQPRSPAAAQLPSADEVRDRLAYDAETGAFTWKISPSNNWAAGSPAGSKNKTGYIAIRLFGRPYQAHRLAWLIVHGTWPAEIDHRDGDKANNRLLNLREATNTQNQANKPCKGYFYNRRAGRFGAALRVGGQKRFLGFFDTAEEARSAYLAAHAAVHGEYSFVHRAAGGQASNNAAHLSAASSPGAQ